MADREAFDTDNQRTTRECVRRIRLTNGSTGRVTARFPPAASHFRLREARCNTPVIQALGAQVQLETAIKIVTFFGGTVGAIFGGIALRNLLFPIRIIPSWQRVFDGSEPDAIQAQIVNLTDKPLVLVACSAKPTYRLRTIITRHLKNPLTPRRLWPNIHFTSQSFLLLNEPQRRLEGKEVLELEHRLSSHPLSFLMAPMFIVEVTLSTGRKFRSRRITAPERWLLINNLDEARNHDSPNQTRA